MIYVTSIYDDKGVKIGEVSKCDHGKWGAWRWREVVVGVFIAVVALGQWAILQ